MPSKFNNKINMSGSKFYFNKDASQNIILRTPVVKNKHNKGFKGYSIILNNLKNYKFYLN